MRFSIIVTGPAYGTQQSSSALLFAHELLNTKHQLISVFFYQEGVYNANKFTSPASDEFDLVRAWQSINKQHGVKLYICASAALRRGIIDFNKAKYLNFFDSNLEDNFIFGGLINLAKAALRYDRIVQF